MSQQPDAQPDLEEWVGQPAAAQRFAPPVEIVRDPLTGVQHITLSIPGERAPGLAEWTAEAKRLGLTVPDGWRVEMVEAKHDPAAWHRDAQGEDAVTRGVWRCRYRLVPDVATLAGDAIRQWIETLPPVPDVAAVDSDDHLVSIVTDLQIGKIDGDGTHGTIARALDEYRRHAARARGGVASVTLIDSGDCIEGVVSGQGASRGRSDLPLTDQVTIAVRLMAERIRIMRAATAAPIRYVVTPGNHDELSRTGGRVDTLFTDSWALVAAKLAADTLNTSTAGVEWHVPARDATTVTLDIGGVVHTVAHGHQWSKADGWRDWWARQAAGRQDAAHATVLVAGHYHHLRVEDFGGGRLFVQAPSLDGGSRWFTERYGAASPARGLSYVVRHGAVRDLDPVLPAGAP